MDHRSCNSVTFFRITSKYAIVILELMTELTKTIFEHFGRSVGDDALYKSTCTLLLLYLSPLSNDFRLLMGSSNISVVSLPQIFVFQRIIKFAIPVYWLHWCYIWYSDKGTELVKVPTHPGRFSQYQMYDHYTNYHVTCCERLSTTY